MNGIGTAAGDCNGPAKRHPAAMLVATCHQRPPVAGPVERQVILMAYFNSLGMEIPDYLWELGLAVRRLIEQYEAMKSWRRHVRGWVKLVREAAEKPNFTGVDVMDLPLAPEIDEEYALLAAVHDNCASPERNEELIHPWAAEADFGGSEKVYVDSEALDAVATYDGLMQHVLPQQGRQRGIERSKGDRLLEILRHVANDVRNAARLWTPDRRLICADESVPDPVEEYASFLRRDSESEDVGADLTRLKVQEADDLEAPVVDGEQAKPVGKQQTTVDERGKETLDEQDTNDSEGDTHGGEGKEGKQSQEQVAALLETIKAALLDETSSKVIQIVSDKSKSAEKKCLAICEIDVRYWGKDSEFWARLCGTTGQAIRKLDFWKFDRPKAQEEVRSAFSGSHSKEELANTDVAQMFSWYKEGGSKEG